MIVYPAIDLLDGRCVRLKQGDFAQKTQYDVLPQNVLNQYAHDGATHCHIVDLAGAKAGKPQQAALIAALLKDSSLTFQVGGGIRSQDDVARYLEVGVSQVVVGSLAIQQPESFKAMLARFGGDALTLAVDVDLQDEPMVATHGWQQVSGTSLWQVLDQFMPLGLRRILCTDIARDGMLSGTNVALYQAIQARYPNLIIQASGGVSSVEDLRQLNEAGVPEVIIGKALYENRFTLQDACMEVS
jgi:phosphoribosylformimino-5-aminoimidazole carboxamide ribotide isomerase